MRRRSSSSSSHRRRSRRRRWKPEPKYDDNGKLVEPSRGDTVQDRLGGYGLNDAEVQGLVTRVEDLPGAKEGGYSDEEWERISAEASAREDYPPTDEQNIIIEGAARRGLNMAVMALAGTGKSSTLKMLSHRMPGKKIVYLAFNRSVAAEAREAQARGEYAKNMLASTANAYAARVADRRLNDRLPSSKAGGFKKLSAQQIADRMRWYDTVKAGNRDLTPGGAATVAERMIREWAKSADAEMGPQHIKANVEGDPRDLFNAVKPLADRMWANLSDPEAGDPDRDLTMDFDYIVKQWALGGYKIDADTLFWDEAQDVNPVMEGVVRAALDQGVQVVAVGDSNQAIYGFRGASDALAKLPVDARATLTQSFRFGPAVADVGNRFLRLLGTRMRLKGFDRKNSRIEQLHPGEESMVIARTNAGVALAAVQALTAGRTVAVSGGVKALQEFVQAAHALAEGEDTDHAELARFNGMAFDDIVEEVKTDPDLQQLASLFNLLEKHGDDIDALLSSGSRPAATELVGDRVWVRLDWNDPNAGDLKRWLGDGKNNGVGKLLYDPATRRYYYEPGKRSVPWKSKTRSGVHKIDNKLSLEEAQQRIDAHLAKLYPQDDSDDGNGRLVPEHEPHDVLVTTAHKAKGLESERVRIADDFKGPEDNDDGNIDWDTIPDDEALRVAYVAVTRATEVLDPGSLGWVFRAVNDDDPTQPPKGEYRRDFKLDDFQTGDQVDFDDEDGTPNIGTISEIDPPMLTVVSTSDEPGIGGKRQEISPAQVRRRNGQARPLLPAATDEELDQAIAGGRYGSGGTTTLDAQRVRDDLANLNNDDTSTATPEGNTDTPALPAAEDRDTPAPAETNTPAAAPEQDLPAKDDQVMTPDGLGDVMAVHDGAVLVRGDSSTRVWPLKDVTRPDGTPFGGDRRGDDTKARKNADDITQASTHEGLELSTGHRLRDLDVEAGHGTIVDADGNTVGWVRARIGDNGRRYWWGQDADGGAPADMQWHEELPDQAGAAPVRAASIVRDGLDFLRQKYTGGTDENGKPEQAKRTPVTPDRAITEMTLTPAQVRELSKLTLSGNHDDGTPIDTLPWNAGHRRYSPYSAQAGALAAAAREAAAQQDQSTPEGRRNRKVLLGAASKMEFQQYDSARRAATIPAPGETDHYAQPYKPRAEEPETDTPEAPEAPAGPDAPAAEPFATDGDWRAAMVPVDAAELQVRRAAGRTWASDDTPSGVNLLGRAVLDALAAQEDNDHDEAERYLVAARDHAAGLLATLEDDERQEMEEPLRRFLDVTDTHLARHRATVRQRRAEDQQREEIEEAAGAQIREAIKRSTAPEEPTEDGVDRSEVEGIDRVNEGDYVRVETQDSAGNAVVREGYLLASPKKITATRDGQSIKAWRLHVGAQGEEPSDDNGVSLLADEKVERLTAPETDQPAVGWKGPDETRETVGERGGKTVEIGEIHVIPAERRFQADEVRRAVYLDGKRIGSLLYNDNKAHFTGGESWRADHALHGSVGEPWYRSSDFDNAAHAAALIVAESDSEPVLSFPRDVGETARAEPIRRWAGIWAQPQPAGVRNVYLDRALAHNREGWTASADPWSVMQWISTMADVEPLAQYDENTRRSLEEAPPEGRQFLADLAEDLRATVSKMGDELRADLRPILMEHIATRAGRKKAAELRNQLVEERAQKVQAAVREQIARARAGAAGHGLSEQQAEDFIVSVVGGDNPDQKSYGIRAQFPEAMRPLNAAVSDSGAYWAAFAGWATQEDSSNWAGMHWANGRRESIGAPMAPFADARTGTGELKIGEAELPKGMRWARGSELRKGDIFHTVKHPRRGTTDGFDGMETPNYVVHTHRGGVEGAVRSVSIDADHGQDRVGPDEWVVLVEKPEPNVRKRATNRARTDINIGWDVPVDDETYELGGPERVKELVARAEVTADDGDKPGLDREWTVRVDGVVIGRIDNTNKDKVLEYVSISPDGERRVWHGRDLAAAGLVVAHDKATGRDEQDDDTRRDEEPEDRGQDTEEEQNQDDDQSEEGNRSRRRGDRDGAAPDEASGNGGDGGTPNPDADNDDQDDDADGGGPEDGDDADDSDAEQRRDRRRRRDRDRDKERGERNGGAPNGGLPHVPGRDRDRDRDREDDDRDRSPNAGGPGGLDGLKNRYRSGDNPTPAGADKQEHAAYLRRLANNDTLTLSPGGGLITWSDDDGRTWQFGHAASGMHLAGWEALGEQIGGRDGAVRLADAYEQLRDENGNPIDWSAPELDAQALRAWRDADGNHIGAAIDQARQTAADAAPGLRRQDGKDDSSAPESDAGRSESSGAQTNGQQPADGAAASNPGSPAGSAQGEAADAPEGAADSQYVLNATHGTGRRGGTVDGRRVPTAKEMEQYETGPKGVVSEEGERVLFGSPERMRAVAAEGFNPTPVLRLDHDGQIWRDGRLIGTLFAPHLHSSGGSSSDGEWWSEPPFASDLTKFATREAAIAHLVLRDKERGEPDLSVVHPDLAWTMRHTAQSLGFPGKEKPFRGLETLADNPVDLERYYALRALLDELGRGVTPSGNVADDLAHLQDELRWLDATHYKHQKPNLKDKYILGPGWLADQIREDFDVLRPEDPRAQHHDASKNRAAHQFIEELLENGGRNNAVRVPISEIREGDVVELDGRITGFYAGYTGRRLGYVIGEPTKATFKASGVRYKGYRVTVSKDQFEGTRHGANGDTFIIPADGGTALRLAEVEDVTLPFDQHRYGRQIGEGPRTAAADDSSSSSNAPEAERQDDTAVTPAATDTSAPESGTDAPRSEDRTEPTAARTTPVQPPADPAADRPARAEGGSDERRQDAPAGAPDATPEPPAAPEPVGGRPAEWVQVSELQLRDLVRIDGVTKQGKARTLAGHVVGGPKLIPVTKKGRATDMYRVLVADNPDARTGSPVYVMPDAAAARATRDDADQFQGSPQTGADSDVLTGRIADSVPTDARGNGLFPGSLVTDDDGKEGVVTGASANSVRVQFGDDRTDDNHSPTSLNVTDGGAGRPSGWTADGRLVRDGNVVGDRDGNMLGTVESVDGDTATVAAPDGMRDLPIADLRVIGDTADGDNDHKVSSVEPTPAGDVQEGDVVVRESPDGPRTARVTGREEEGEQTHLDLEDTTTGETEKVSTASDSDVQRALGADGNPPELGPEDAPASGDEITSHEPAPAVDPVAGPTVDPQLSPEERDAITDRGQAPASDPDAQQGAARVANDLPLTPGQATALAEELREGADSATPEGRAAQRAADHLDAAAGNEPDDVDQPEPGTVGSVGEGDTITLPDEFDPDTMTAYRVVQIQEAPGGVRVLTIEDGDGMRFKRSLASSEPLYQLPEPEAPAADDDAEQRDPNPAPDAGKVRADYADAVVRAVIDSALDGTTTPGSIHQLRQQIAERLTPEALRAGMRRARNGAMAAITDAGFEGQERDDLVQSLRKEAARARTDAVRAAVRTLDDLEPLDGESEEDTASRAADLLRLIPEALRTRAAGDDNTDGEAGVNDDVTQHADDAVGEALQAAADSGELLTPERRAAIVQQLAARMDSSRNATAQRIASRLPEGQRAGILPHIVAGLVAIARRIIALVAAFLKALAKAWRAGRENLRRMRERISRFRQGLMRRIRSWPEARRLRRLAAAGRLPQHADGLPLGDRVAHWARLLPAPGRFGQVSRRARWYRPTSRSSLAAGQLPEVQDGVRWTMDRSVDGGPGPQALRHLAAVRAAGQDVDTDVVARLSAAAPELGDDPHGTVRHAANYADTAERRLRDLEAAAAGGAPGADLEVAAARVEAQSARQEAARLQQAYAAALPDAVRGTLAEVREMGPGTTATLVTTPDSDSDAVRALTGVAQFVPRDWLSPTEARFLTARGGDAGGYDPTSRIATVADLGDDGRRTAAHALLAHLQQHYPDLLAAQEAFHFTRTHSGRVGARRRTSLDRLLARMFRNSNGQGDTGNLVPLGLATLFEGQWYEDDDLRAFLLGLLATR
ncbi:hypothetical protein C6N75_00065 [Streptomyces solincola]|uniref:UvrD-like helicase ATP-binding domain-containing protein n=1 Tax=Streptomyces solincola TaxID=2100817 RepID=A0A2S9Q3I6_9ACTN|nr:UvrD-helicase domain-containing protein [Streptomyces solincola]PRH81198.1 hypothetical protein C6N75_00065 [Streptomyces solincola]